MAHAVPPLRPFQLTVAVKPQRMQLRYRMSVYKFFDPAMLRKLNTFQSTTLSWQAKSSIAGVFITLYYLLAAYQGDQQFIPCRLQQV